MSENYFLRYKNKTIGVFSKIDNRLSYKPNKEIADTIPNGLGYPLGLFPLDFSKKGLFPLINYFPSEDDIKLWLSDRVFPADREGAYNLLNAMGLNTYDMWEIAKRTKAVSYNDHYWMSSDPNDKYEDIHPLFAVESGDESSSSIKYI
jgi:hypothetical protein